MNEMLYVGLTLFVASVLALWNGWGLARLLLPAALQPWRALLAPLLGYALTILVGYWVVRFAGGLGLALGLLLPLGGLLNGLAWRRTGPPHLAAALRQHWPVLLVALIGVAIGIAPLFSYGYIAPIGGGWDVENYWPVARYLTRGPVSAIATAPANPLRDINADPPRIGLTLGFSIWQGSVDLLSASEPLLSFAPLLAWLRALGVIGIYVLLQALFDLRRGPAAFGALLAALNGLLLWTSFFNFGMQLAAWPLIPLALILGLAAVQPAPGQPFNPLIAAAIGLAAIPVAYYPALGPIGLMAAGIGVVTLWQTRPRWPLIQRALILVLLTLVLAAPTIPDYFAGFNYRYSLPLTTLGLFRFVPLSDIVGLTLFRLREAPEPLSPPLWLAAIGLAGFAGYGLLAGPQRGRWLGLLAGAGGFLLYLRFGAAYHYGYLKAAAYMGWLAGALAASGWQAALDHLRARPQWLRRLVAVSATAVIGSAVAFTGGRVVADHWGQPGLFANELPALRELRRVVPAGSTVWLTGDPRVQGVTSGLAAYLLDHAVVWGDVRTGYTSSNAGAPDAVADYALLQRDEDPILWGYADPPIWSSGSYRLYRRPEGLLAHLRLAQVVDGAQSVTIPVSANRLSPATPSPNQEQVTRWIQLQTVTLTPAELTIDGRRYAVPAGLGAITFGPLTTPHTLTIQSGTAPIRLQAVSLLDSPPASAGMIPHSVALSAASVADGLRVATTIDLLIPDSGPLVVALELWDRRQGTFFGRYGLRLGPAATAQSATVAIDLATGAPVAYGAAGEPLPLGVQQGVVVPGTYTARLWAGTDQRALLTPVDLFAFTIDRTGGITLDWVAQYPLMAARIDRPLQPLAAQFGDDMLLRGYDLLSGRITAGDTLAITLWWQALRGNLDERSIMLHLRNDRDERMTDADGPPAAGGRPTSLWQAGELIIDDRRLTIPADLPPGRYWLVVGSYRWPSLELVPLRAASEPVWRIPIEIIAPDDA
ncbi:hypothetical protein A6A03_15785 [Chloroflexus islandicus]|uniref:Uncharacterized protein n=1 Tax=Chloroflexus islandicus TaxID=1707952 RepID=A0A178MA59_9CHLR|nr:hypothetical protein [Chloroflexus islandicus]OAN44928.1 hypothetical protein A6A03_15785 [Chloroflexus islandicus]